jgi:hypothetical protein
MYFTPEYARVSAEAWALGFAIDMLKRRHQLRVFELFQHYHLAPCDLQACLAPDHVAATSRLAVIR